MPASVVIGPAAKSRRRVRPSLWRASPMPSLPAEWSLGAERPRTAAVAGALCGFELGGGPGPTAHVARRGKGLVDVSAQLPLLLLRRSDRPPARYHRKRRPRNRVSPRRPGALA